MMSGEPQKFLVIRRDNIGDLACTTPLIAALRERYPRSFIGALVNSYNRDVLAGNPDLDEVYDYTKAKHRQARQSLARVYADRLRLYWKLRRVGFDIAILAAPGFQRRALRFARFSGARRVLGFVTRPAEGGIEIAVPYGEPQGSHETEDVFRLLAPLGVQGPPPAMKVSADAKRAARVREALAARIGARNGPLVALHVSSRKLSQRWPAEHFAGLARVLHARRRAAFLLLWAPGSASDPRHPGDDEKATALAKALDNVPLLAYPTHALGDLIAALDACDALVCSDGGAMHLAAALSKPIVCFFGDSSASRWRPWKARHELLQPESRDVRDISTEQAAEAFERVMKNEAAAQ